MRLRLRIVKQSQQNDCGIAAAAIACGRSYRAAQSCDPNPDSLSGVSVIDMAELLSRLSRSQWRVIKPRYRPLSGYRGDLAGVRIALIRGPAKPRGHWIAIVDGKVYDPDPRIKRIGVINEYNRKGWTLLRILTPSSPATGASTSPCSASPGRSPSSPSSPSSSTASAASAATTR